jgi:hypothetical protein
MAEPMVGGVEGVPDADDCGAAAVTAAVAELLAL